MSLRLWWRDSARRQTALQTAAFIGVFFIWILTSSIGVLGQARFASDYTDAERLYRNGDWAKAEQMFLTSIKEAPKERGASVRLVSQQYGFYPEYFLALIYGQQGRQKEMETYATLAKKYLKRDEPLYLILVGLENHVANGAVATETLGDIRGVTGVTTSPAVSSTTGPMYALVIGIDHYDDSAFPTLTTAVNDARAVSAVLRDQYQFDTTLLVDATRNDVLSALEAYRRKAEPTSSLLIYYAGHGSYDKDSDKASWIPKNGYQAMMGDWIAADDITNRLKAIPARHIIVIADSCYSGGLSREASADVTIADHTRYVEKAASRESRNLLSSGGNEPVSDGGGTSGHSIFATALLKGLNGMEPNEFTALELFRDYIAVQVSGRSTQTPQYVPIRNSGHDDGDFVFRRKIAR